MNFELHPNFSDKYFIVDLPLCRVLLEDNSHYPWIFLIPRIPNAERIMDLHKNDQLLLMNELDLAQNIIWKLFDLTQLNVAAIGNKTPQLHIHVIGRKINDPAWPNTVWDHSLKHIYSKTQREGVISLLQSAFNQDSGLTTRI
ncbi:MAG: HIT domain-containing protein [Parachlamydiaceae bacterium]|nr:HIT domain-containing protein [Parachlamydiaceae bacterium]